MDVLQRLDQTYAGDLDIQIQKYQQLAKLISEKIWAMPSGYSTSNNIKNLDEANKRIVELQMERNVCLLRLPRRGTSKFSNFSF